MLIYVILNRQVRREKNVRRLCKTEKDLEKYYSIIRGKVIY